MVYRLTTREETLDRFDKVFAYRTAHTSIRDLDDFFGGFLDEISIDTCRAVFILYDSDLPTVCIAEDMIQKCCLSTSEKSGEDSDRYHRNLLLS